MERRASFRRLARPVHQFSHDVTSTITDAARVWNRFLFSGSVDRLIGGVHAPGHWEMSWKN
jgi:hypothetical protein